MPDPKGTFDRKICTAGIEKGKEPGPNPTCVFADMHDKLALPPGAMATTRNNRLYSGIGDPVINAGDSAVQGRGSIVPPTK